jgi:hypothetical protein
MVFVADLIADRIERVGHGTAALAEPRASIRSIRAIRPNNWTPVPGSVQPSLPIPTPRSRDYSHSIVAGGLLETSNTTRLTPLTSLMIREASFSSRSYGSRTQSAVMPSCDSTTRMAMV